MSEILKGRNFQFWDYRVSHGSLLIRSPKKGEDNFNIDIKFYGVEYVAVPRHLKGVSISTATKEEVLELKNKLGKSLIQDNIFVLESSSGRHIIIASKMKVDKSDMDIFDSPFEHM